MRVLAATLLLVLACHAAALDITRDTTLDPAKTYGPLVVKASRVTIDGRGAWVVGATEGKPNAYAGVGILAEGVSHVTLKNVRVRGFETGLSITDGEGWTIEDCDFSDNFHDPDFGWGENGRRGGIVLTRVSRSTVRRNHANRDWDGCALVESDENTIEENDFSHASNTCLKLWTSCRNTIRKNNLSYGIRISPGEVHARDSTSVLVESGSNDNRFLENDATHGGDGIFVRVLNGWVSTGNHFEGNDVSHANNNGFEAWSPRNTYVRNKANYCSYGFWLGASDKTVLLENEAAYSGVAEGSHNSPHLPDGGFSGIVFMFGPSSHTVLRGNRCHHNNGAGIAAIGDDGGKFKAFHWIVEENELQENRWGLYLKNADWLDLARNSFDGNRENVHAGAGVTNLFDHADDPAVAGPPRAALSAPTEFVAGEEAVFDAGASSDPAGRSLAYRWDLGDGTVSTEPGVAHTYARPGFYRAGLTVTNGLSSDLAWVDVYVTERLRELEGEWDWVDPASRLSFTKDRENRIQGTSSLRAEIDPYGGGRTNLLYPKSRRAGISLDRKTSVVFWMRYVNTNTPAWQDANPIITLYESETRFLRLVPSADLMSNPPYLEGRDGWTYFEIPLAGSETWKREGEGIERLAYLTIGVDSWGGSRLLIWIDGLAVK
ncbi:MAG: right-handed parallel beta-helix repeat-containing protein [Planctomycetes bacterium]|nr:right-handed parallel beta-helix repeat-containing protein [Planctomycetota bacterium]